ncbi:penicillin acylase family protein, partial [Streptomyces sp. NPDC048312]|uniref:penicillin acylase family protein n=1 Tax=Streptomyces sp. NPDC048312 TaxID=3155485 RepID=UPI0033C8749A
MSPTGRSAERWWREQPTRGVWTRKEAVVKAAGLGLVARYGTEFGAGFAAGQDRLWLMDLFRHIGRGEL